MKKLFNKIFVTKNEFYLLIVWIFFVIAVLFFAFIIPNKFSFSNPIEFEIKEGDTLEKITDSLYSKKIIPNKLNFRIAVFLKGADKKIKAGEYIFDKSLNYFQLVEILSGNVKYSQKKITIPEGVDQFQLASLLKNELGIDSTEFIGLSKSKSFIFSLGLEVENLEGYLLPETYFFTSSMNSQNILKKLSKEMKKFLEDKKERMKQLKINEHQLLTLASIIDAESNNFDEFAKISAVYHNRLRIGMPLQADPTISFLIRERKNKTIYKKDLSIESKYNTYKYVGLPPSPINNPGKQAILAALYPEKNNYLYFVADGNGSHLFAATYNEHLQNVIKYRQWLRSQN
ncbi:MAG: endolytic transglycosylase MltG [Melioribacteraceae bacterium]|nr:endolytic transglycosylase MltG [Melioribacteraceae bacterium]